AVARHRFLPDRLESDAYHDRTIVTKTVAGLPVSSASRPATVARMLEQLDVKRGQRVLEVGTGTGYNAALLAHITGSLGCVTTVEIDPELAARAQDELRAEGLSN